MALVAGLAACNAEAHDAPVRALVQRDTQCLAGLQRSTGDRSARHERSGLGDGFDGGGEHVPRQPQDLGRHGFGLVGDQADAGLAQLDDLMGCRRRKQMVRLVDDQPVR